MKVKQSSPKSQLIVFFLICISFFILLLITPRITLPLGIAYIIALILRPLKNSLISAGTPKKIAIVLVTFLGLVLFGYPFVKIIPDFRNKMTQIEEYVPRIESYSREKFKDTKQYILETTGYALEIDPIDSMLAAAEKSTRAVIVYVPQMLASIFEWGIMIPLFVFFILKDGRAFKDLFLRITPNSIVEKVYYLSNQFNRKFGDYILAKFIEASIVGAVITIGLLILDFPFAFLLGIIAAITNILPYVGPFLGYIPALVIGLVDQNPNTTLGAMTLLYAIANIIDLVFVFPLLVSKVVNLHPVIVMTSVVIGSQFAGIVGMVISIPVAAFFKLVFSEIYKEIYRSRLV